MSRVESKRDWFQRKAFTTAFPCGLYSPESVTEADGGPNATSQTRTTGPLQQAKHAVIPSVKIKKKKRFFGKDVNMNNKGMWYACKEHRPLIRMIYVRCMYQYQENDGSNSIGTQ